MRSLPIVLATVFMAAALLLPRSADAMIAASAQAGIARAVSDAQPG